MGIEFVEKIPIFVMLNAVKHLVLSFCCRKTGFFASLRMTILWFFDKVGIAQQLSKTFPISRFVFVLSLVTGHWSLITDASAQPYYAAMKGLSCSACHVNPAGAGVRKISEGSPTFINNAIALGADLRGAYSNDGNPLADYSFKALQQRIYLTAEPAESLIFAYSNESGSTAEAYGMLKREEWFDFYVRFGKFFLPYGLQISDPDNSAFIKTGSFAPKSAGFSLQPGLTDTGIEYGLYILPSALR